MVKIIMNLLSNTVLTFVRVTSCKIRGTDGVHMDVSAERGVVNFGI